MRPRAPRFSTVWELSLRVSPGKGCRVQDALLFVYGTLRRGHPHHDRLEGAPFSGACATVAGYAIRQVEGYPVLIPGSSAIPGELYWVGAGLLERLDVFEGPNYRRGSVELEDGRVVLAYLLADR